MYIQNEEYKRTLKNRDAVKSEKGKRLVRISTSNETILLRLKSTMVSKDKEAMILLSVSINGELYPAMLRVPPIVVKQ